MASADTENPLAYLDYSQLTDVMGRNWEQFEPTLIRRSSWDSTQEELLRIRHRIGHVRRPYEDDLNRVEQTLRDLEHGAFVACASYNRQTAPDAGDHADAVTTGWIARRYQVAGADRACRQPLRVSDFWHAASFAVARPRVLHLVADDPSHVGVTFAAADDDQAVADAIGDALETFFSVSRHGYLEEDKQRRWRRRALMPGLGLPRDSPHPRCSAH